MKLIIDIPEEEYKFINMAQNLIIGGRGSCRTIQKNVINAIRNGIPYEARPQGDWGKWVISEVRCPNCLEHFDTDCYSLSGLDICPNCGADMRGGRE